MSKPPYKTAEVRLVDLRVQDRLAGDSHRFSAAMQLVESGEPLHIWVSPIGAKGHRVLIGNIYVHAIRQLTYERYCELFPNGTVPVYVRSS